VSVLVGNLQVGIAHHALAFREQHVRDAREAEDRPALAAEIVQALDAGMVYLAQDRRALPGLVQRGRTSRRLKSLVGCLARDHPSRAVSYHRQL